MNDELWRVQLGTGEIRTMTLDGLDRAFNEGTIDARTRVLAPGAAAWSTLAEVAGLDDECPTDPMPSLSPVAISSDESSSAAPITAPSELELPDEIVDFAPRRRRLVVGGVFAALSVAALIALGIGMAGQDDAAPSKVDTTTASPAPPAADPHFEPAAAVPATTNGESEAQKPALSDWQKKLLIEADKARDEDVRAKQQQEKKKVNRAKRSTPKTTPGLLNGGDRFDPLNGAL